MVKSSDQDRATRKPVGQQRRPGGTQALVGRLNAAHEPPRGLRARRQRRSAAGDRMRARIVDAALQTLRAEGYAGVSVRTIAAAGAFSPALVFYHFGSVDGLLLAVLDRVSGDRLARYEARLRDVSSLRALASALEELYDEDLQLGQLTAVQEIVGAMAFDPELGPEIASRMQPWMTFAEQLAARIVGGSPLAGLVDPAVVGSAVIALYMGLEIVTRMQGGDTTGSRALVATLSETAPWIDRLLGKGAPAPRRRTTRLEVE
jgi:AcrR family transcriptional regulator